MGCLLKDACMRGNCDVEPEPPLVVPSTGWIAVELIVASRFILTKAMGDLRGPYRRCTLM